MTQPRGKPLYWTADRILAALRAFVAQYGRWPETVDFHAGHGLPHPVTVWRVFGTLARARRAAGMPGGGHEGWGGSGRGGGWRKGRKRPRQASASSQASQSTS